ncbi:ABC transporter substrate-binding protein [Deefgea salmonis]|uniref:Extracellular solute-binding protein n=1 Tax=Deefgea salmonis TaxID=2875502 RepID=A0ABS8BIW4_9NEIS|nr:extracellular solute-binding protein [Deefgea salmonis]MCB5195654.1 extracellular solute-binding protein [Deefgea salmonis]
MNFKRSVLVGAALFAASVVSAQAATKVEFWSHSLAPTYDAYHKELVAKFNSSQKEIDLTWKDLGWGAMKPAIVAAVAEGNVPGLALVPTDWMNEMAPKLLTPVTKIIAPFKGQYTDAALANATVDGQIYGFPSYQVTAVMVYNKDMLAKAGVKPEFKTLDDVFNASKQIKAKTGKPGWASKLQDGFQGWFMFEGLPIVSGGKAVFNSPKHVALVQKFADAYKEGTIVKDVNLDFDKQIAGFANGSFAMFAEGGHAVKKIKDANPAAYAAADVTTFPLGDNGKFAFGGWTTMYVVPKGQKDLASVAKVAQFITGEEAQAMFSKASYTFASTKNANAIVAKDVAMNDDKDPGKKAFKMGGSVISKTRHFMLKDLPAGADEAALGKVMNDKIDAAIQGRIPVKQALDEAVAAWNVQFAK